MLLHLVTDDKFIDAMINSFETVYPNKNKFLVGVNSYEYKLKYINQKDKVFIAPYGSKEYYNFIGDITEYDAVILHYLDIPKLKIVQDAPDRVKFVWNSWGADIYNRLPIWRYKLYGKQTERLVARILSSNIWEYYLRISISFRLLQNIRAELKLKQIRKILHKITYFSTVLPPEKYIIKKHYQIKGIYVPFNYTLNLLNSENYKKFINKNVEIKNILLGNSAAATNNHIEILEILSKFNLSERKIITPLSYGGNSKYVARIKACGQQIFGNNFFSLDSMLNKYEYFDLISSCSICIMNHYRQNGMGNVIFMIWLGVKVFLSERNPAYSYFKSLNIVLYSVEKELNAYTDDTVFDRLPEDIRESNRKIIENLYSYDATLKKIANFVNVITRKSQMF